MDKNALLIINISVNPEGTQGYKGKSAKVGIRNG